MIALAILTLTVSAVIIVVFGNQSLTVDTQTNIEALAKAESQLEEVRGLSKQSFSSAVTIATYTWTAASGRAYTASTSVQDLTDCYKQATSTVAWTQGGRSLSTTLTTFLFDLAGASIPGSTCEVPPTDDWKKPKLFASYKFNPGQPLNLTVLDRIVYMSDDRGKLHAADTTGAYLGFTGGVFSDTFDATSTLPMLDVAEQGGKRYVYAARGKYPSCDSGDTSQQLQVYDVTDPLDIRYKRSLSLKGSVPPTGSCPGGRVVRYFDNRVYISTWFTAGNEFHIFDVSNPLAPVELGPGYEVGGSANTMEMAGPIVNSIPRRVAYLATDRSTQELMVLDVTDASNPTLLTSVNLIDCPAQPDALSLEVFSNRLFIGRQKTACGPELYVYDIKYGLDGGGNLKVTLAPVGTGAEVNADVVNLRVAGRFAFLAVDDSTAEFQVWNVGNPAKTITRVETSPLNLPNKIVGGLDFENPYIYAGSQAVDPLQILYSAP